MKSFLLALFLVVTGLLIRFYLFQNYTGFDFDQETAAQWIRHFITNHKVSLIGQEISVGGIFTGPGYYYVLSIAYWLFGGNPLAGNYLQLFFAAISMILIYRLGKLTALFIYAFSATMITIDQTATPSSPMILLGTLSLLLSRSIAAQFALTGIGWHFHPTAILFAPIGILNQFLSKTRFEVKALIQAVVIMTIFFLPLLLFDFRHDFLHFKNLYQLFLGSHINLPSYPIIFRLIISGRIFLESWLNILAIKGNASALVSLLIILFVFRNELKKYLSWFVVPIVFLGVYPRAFPEYYYFLIYPAIILVSANIITKIVSYGVKGKITAFIALAFFLLINFNAYINRVNPYPIKDKLSVVNYLVDESKKDGLPLRVKIISDLGQGNGFNYLFWWKTNKDDVLTDPASYTIFVPSKLSTESGTTFGNIKVIDSNR